MMNAPTKSPPLQKPQGRGTHQSKLQLDIRLPRGISVLKLPNKMDFAEQG
jgi:hypothetical protein